MHSHPAKDPWPKNAAPGASEAPSTSRTTTASGARPVHDDRVLFEFLILEGAQAGLSWSTILRKREAYRKAFAGFDPAKVARFTPARVEKLMGDAGIVRNRLKIEGAREEREGLPRGAEGVRQLRRLRVALRGRQADGRTGRAR